MWFRNIFTANRAGHGRAAGRGGSAGRGLVDLPPAGGPAHFAGLTTPLLNQLNRLRLNTGLLVPGQPVGSRSSAVRKPASDFRDHRPYTPGDDIRYVDWKASARQEHVFIKQGEDPKAAVVHILIDCSASMAWGDPPKARAALALANAFSYLALAHNDRLVLIPIHGSRSAGAPGAGFRQSDLRALGPLWGKGHTQQLNRYLDAIPFQGQVDLSRALKELSQRRYARGGLVLVISDLLGARDLEQGLAALPPPDWKVVVCHLLHPAELEPHLDGTFEMEDIETGRKKVYPVSPRVLALYRQRLQSWQDEMAQVCQKRSAVYTLIPTHWSLEDEVMPHLQHAQVVNRL